MIFINSFRYNYELLKRYQHLLQKGIYVLHPNLRSYVKLGKIKNPYLPNADSGIKWGIMYMTSLLYSKLVTRGNDDGYEFVYISNMPEFEARDIKLFAPMQAKVLTICQSSKRYENIIAKKRFVGEVFPIPQWREVNGLQGSCFEERLVDLQNRQTIIQESYLIKLVLFYSNYFCAVKKNQKYCKNGLYYQHGDLSIDNVFIERNGELCFIDFDHSDYFPAFYDVFYQIVNNYIMNGDITAISYLRNSKVVGLMKQLEQRSISYYFEAYIDMFIKRLFVPMSETDKVRYCDIFDQIRKILSE